jgi:gliding motility-associated-like protein
MKILRYISLTLLSVIIVSSLAGQDVTQPSSPVLDMVTVDPHTGFVTVRWLPSDSPDVGSYVVYAVSNNTAYAVDTIRSPLILEYIHTGSAARYMSVTYVVAAMDSSLNISPLSNSLSTIFLTMVNDSCNSRLVLSWQPYINAVHPADRYELWRSSGGAPTALFETLPLTATDYTYYNYEAATQYCFYIAVADINGILSTSNMPCVITSTEKAPLWTIAEAVAVEQQHIVIRGSYDPATDIQEFIAEQYEPVSMEWMTSGSGSGMNGLVTINVSAADTSHVNLYRISAVNNCGKAVTASPAVRNIVLTSAFTGTRIDLKWNNPFPSGPALYSVWRDIGQGWEETVVSISDTLWSDDYGLFAPYVSSAAVAYYVTGIGPDAPVGTPLFRSNVTLVPARENIFVANAFTPDGDGLNDIFMPVLSFTPMQYDFRVYSRAGVMLFHTSSHGGGWDGRYNNMLMPPGVYLWSLRLTTPSGHSEQKTGTVTILP